jgi:hypothetical protein
MKASSTADLSNGENSVVSADRILTVLIPQGDPKRESIVQFIVTNYPGVGLEIRETDAVLHPRAVNLTSSDSETECTEIDCALFRRFCG